MPIKHRVKYIAAEVEGTKGTAATLTAADAAILAFDPSMDPDIEFDERAPAGLAMGSLVQIEGTHAGRFQGRVEVRGSGTAGTLPLWASTLLMACGFNNTNVPATSDTLNLISSIADEKTVSIALWEDGVKKMIIGAMGNARIEGEVGKRCFVMFDFRGIWITPTDVANPTGISHEATLPRRFAASTFTLGGSYPAPISRFAIDLGNQVELRPSAQATNGSGLSYAYIANRKPVLSFDPEHVTVAVHDLFGKYLTKATQALLLVIGSVAGNIFTLTAPALQYIDPKSANRLGLLTHDVNCNLAAEDGDDELEIVFT